MKKLILLFSILNILFVSKLFAQLKDKYTKGTIILQDGKSVDAYIRQRGLEKMTAGFFYKTSSTDGKEGFYSDDQIAKIELENGQVYQSLKCAVPRQRDSVAVLASLLLKGKMSLYETYYNHRTINIIVNNGETYWLQDDEIEDGKMVRYHYKNTLLRSFTDDIITQEEVEETSLSDKDLIKIIRKYNQSFSSESKLIEIKEKPESFLVASAGGRYKSASENEFYLQVTYRKYFPWVSRNTSLNVGLSTFRNMYEVNWNGVYPVSIERRLYSLPFYIQQNLLDRGIRSYLFGGLNLSYVKEKSKDDYVRMNNDTGFQKSYGIGFLLGAGVEADLLKNFSVKTEIREENYWHGLMLGFTYNFRM